MPRDKSVGRSAPTQFLMARCHSCAQVSTWSHDVPCLMFSFPLSQRTGYPLVNLYKANWKTSPFRMGKLTMISMAIFQFAMLVITRGYINPWQIPINPIEPPFSYGFPMIHGKSQDDPTFSNTFSLSKLGRLSPRRPTPKRLPGGSGRCGT